MYKCKYNFTWKIENFSFCHHNNGMRLSRPLFENENIGKIVGDLQLYPRGKSEEYSEFISCSLTLLTADYFDSIQGEIEAIGASGKILKNKKWNTIFTPPFSAALKFYDFLAIEDNVQDAEDCAEDTLTICCKFHTHNSTEIVTDEDFVYTKIGVNRNTVEMCVPRGGTTKRLLTLGSNNNFEIYITEKNEIIKVRFIRVVAETADNKPCIVDCTLTLIDVWNSKLYSEREKHYFSSENCSNWEFPSEALSREWLNFLDDNTQSYARFYCEFSVSNGTYLHFNMPKSKSSSILDDSSTTTSASPSLQEDLRNLFHNKHLCDVKLRVDGETLEAHKNILVARSPVFAVMFDHQDMLESRSGIVDIVDIDAHIMKSFLEFLYIDSVDEMDYEISTKLLMAAEKYQVLSLKEKCAMFLKNDMSEENVCEILSLADAVNHEFLKLASIEYIIAKSATILSSPQWIPWMENNMKLATAVFAKLTLSQSSTKN
ncbi:uncharacterized protein [Parasteatoda tepidariorum]|uniref:uncharacterized protein n=1 Tax=Parasteatoda tepidariorum TaxID=114398 RepID=UPI00077FC999|nr:uncharacterized protein LOC107449569 [Parasteatoda tepidariorum]